MIQRWEYKIITANLPTGSNFVSSPQKIAGLSLMSEAALAKLGDEGWGLAGVITLDKAAAPSYLETFTVQYIFKRSKL
jgi:hypothetical protein